MREKMPALLTPSVEPELARRVESSREAWRVLEIMSEFIESTERLTNIAPAVSLFGSARTPRDSAYYLLAETIARNLSDAGFAVISGGGPCLMEAANKGAYFGRSPSVGLNIQLPHEQSANAYQDVSQTFRHFFARKVAFVKFAVAYVVLPGGATFVPPSATATNLGLGDDSETSVALSAAFPYPGGSTTSLNVASNGHVSTASNNAAFDYTPTPAEFLAWTNPTWAVWRDFICNANSFEEAPHRLVKRVPPSDMEFS